MVDVAQELARLSNDPLAFVMFAFPWGEAGSELEHAVGPEQWQVELLEDVRKGLLTIDEAIRIARASGHGIGKSAAVSWLILWALSTFEDTKGVVTANTETQLKTKTWAELAKWFRLFIGKEMFKMTATALYSADPAHEKTWRMDMVPWSERNTEAFAGLHNKGKRIIVVYDEASAIPDVIHEVSEGALTDKGTQILWFMFGNPTKNKGRFREAFAGGKFAHRWKTATIDSRTVSFTNKQLIEEWLNDYGEDSDFFRIRVRGEFPRVDAESFIPYSLALAATQRNVAKGEGPLIIGVDVGRFGDDPSVIYARRGRDGLTIPPTIIYKQDTMRVAAIIVEFLNKHHASAVFVDEGGVGGGVVDRLRMLGVPVIGVDFGGAAMHDDENDGTKYANRRAEIWGRLRSWLKDGCIPARIHGLEMTMIDELVAPNYGLVQKKVGEAIQLESKKDMRSRGVKSPNLADALALTFAEPVYDPSYSPVPVSSEQRITPDYNPFERGAF